MPRLMRVEQLKFLLAQWLQPERPSYEEGDDMTQYSAVVMDSAHARYFTLKSNPEPSVEGGPELVEQADLCNPEALLKERELFSNLRGRNRAPVTGPAHRYDDHRAAHTAETTKRFAQDLVSEAEALLERASESGPHVLVVAADPSMLGQVRPMLAKLEKRARIVEVGKELTQLSPREIHEALAAQQALPARKNPTHTRAGRLRA